MSDTLDIGLIGLGVMGQRMLARLALHPRLRAVVVWDADPAAVARTLAAYPGCQPAHSAATVIATPGLASLYVATPPGPHMALSEAAFDAGLAVLCEKPLTTDFAAAQRCIDRIAREGRRAAVNFSLASSPGLAALQSAWAAAAGGAAGPMGALQQVDIDLAFAAWPRPWQAAAGPWLAQRAEGGFCREVLSHFIFVLQRVLGTASVQQSQAVFAADGVGAETAISARLLAGGVPVQVRGRVDADAPDDFNRMLWTGSAGAVALQDWFGLQQQAAGGDWQARGDAAAMRAQGQAAQLDQWVAMIEGRPHGLPGYAEALAVQQTIEALLAGA